MKYISSNDHNSDLKQQTKKELKRRKNQISSCGDDPNVLCFSCLYSLVVADLF